LLRASEWLSERRSWIRVGESRSEDALWAIALLNNLSGGDGSMKLDWKPPNYIAARVMPKTQLV
jgi:hypothetical protein